LSNGGFVEGLGKPFSMLFHGGLPLPQQGRHPCRQHRVRGQDAGYLRGVLLVQRGVAPPGYTAGEDFILDMSGPLW